MQGRCTAGAWQVHGRYMAAAGQLHGGCVSGARCVTDEKGGESG